MANLGFSGKLVCSVSVSDHRQSAAWYVENLGFEVVFESPEMGMSYLSTPIDNVWLDLSQVERPEVKGPALVWGVKSIDAARFELEAKGVRFDGPTREYDGMVKLATFFDPDGNTLMFYESVR
ncbi:MAG: VOC family protein [Fimbriimonadaceae bacterium]|nr:VOC family protein [Fimbriimonadaceae bacterium]